MDVTKLVAINKDIDNVHHVPYPHAVVGEGAQHEPHGALFMGTPFKVIPDLDQQAYVARVNQCLEYVRTQCKGCRLQYLVHPAETDEYRMLDLRDFAGIAREKIDDTYFERHRHELKYFFAAHSIAALVAYSLGINSYLFLDCLKGFYPESLWQWYRQVCFNEMPESFFISNFHQPLQLDQKTPSDGHELAEQVQQLLKDGTGTVWFILQVTPLDALLSVARMVRKLYPHRPMGLLISRHHRWDVMDLDSLRPLFDQVHVFPRIFFSLRPKRLWNLLQLTRQVKNFPIGPDDVFFGFAGYELLENCFISYHPKNFRASFWVYRGFLVHQNTAENQFFAHRKYAFTPASYLYNKIILPLLGLHRVIFLKPKGQDSELYTIHRYMRPMNELYDHVFYLHA